MQVVLKGDTQWGYTATGVWGLSPQSSFVGYLLSLVDADLNITLKYDEVEIKDKKSSDM